MRTMLLILVVVTGCETIEGRGVGGTDAGVADGRVAHDLRADGAVLPLCFADDPVPGATVDVVACPGAPDGGAAACTYRETRPNGSTLRVSGCRWAGRVCVAACGDGGP